MSNRTSHFLRHPLVVLFILAAAPAPLCAQTGRDDFRDPKIWHEVEAEMLAEINLLRSQPSQYADDVLAPLKENPVRLPEDASADFEAYRVFLKDAEPIDYIEIREGETAEASLAVVDEAIAALKAAPKLETLKRNEVLEKAARYFSLDFLDGGRSRPPHVDSLQRGTGKRLAAFGATRESLVDWDMFQRDLDEKSETLLRVYEREGTFFRVLYPKRGRYVYRYWSIPEEFAKFVIDNGKAVTVPLVDKPGHECLVRVDRKARTVHCGEATVPFPIPMPIYGENVAWGPWSRRWAARGLVCWWLLDPGVPSRSHRTCLLDPDYRHCGVGCAWSAKLGWAATFDASSEPFEEYEE